MANPNAVVAPEPMDFDRPECWVAWIKRFNRYLDVSGKGTAVDTVKISNMIYFMGAAAEEILVTFGLTEDESKVYETVKKRFQDYFLKMTNIIFERAQFNLQCQQEGEPAADFVTDLYKR